MTPQLFHSIRSYKWAGGGLLSDVHDLLKFANGMLYSYKTPNGVLKQETMQHFWHENKLTRSYFMKDLPVSDCRSDDRIFEITNLPV